jgi:HEAT repeat protein
MRVWAGLIVVLGMLACGGCSKEKSTTELVADLKGAQGEQRVGVVRLLAQRKGDAGQVVPVLIEALKDKDGGVRHDAAIGLGSFGEQAKDAIPALQTAQHDHDARVCKAAGIALSRIDPQQFPDPSKSRPAQEK